MYREMEEAGLPEPEYKIVAFMVYATIKNKKYFVEAEATKNQDVAQNVAQNVAQGVVQEEVRTLAEINEISGLDHIKCSHYLLRKM